MESDIVSGQQSAWVLLKKIGEGDAGEVYRVESLLEKQEAILKRPVHSAFASDIIRQTAQITTEGKILKTLSAAFKMDADFSVNVPEVLDQSKPGTAFSERLFIIIDKARGFDLSFLARAAHLGTVSGVEMDAHSAEEKRFLQTLAENGKMPERVLLSSLNTLMGMFKRIHNRDFDVEGQDAQGILWNDVKPEHLFWDPWRACLTIIDWGNGQFLERDGATRDRRYSYWEDYRQLIEEMGHFLETYAPNLLVRLDWPQPGAILPGDEESLQAFQERIWEALQEQLFELREVREAENRLLHGGINEAPDQNPLRALEKIHQQIIQLGEYPDYAGALALVLNYAARFAETSQFAEVQEICDWAIGLPGSNADHLHMVANLARITSQAQTATANQRNYMSGAIQAALKRDWPSALWSLVSALQHEAQPDWWYDLIGVIRQQQLGVEAGEAQPLLIVRRTLLTLQSLAERMEHHPENGSLSSLQDLIHRLREEMIPDWLSVDPDPPFSNLTYQEIDEVIEEITAFLPDIGLMLKRVLNQPHQQVVRVLKAWDQEEFDQAAAGLRDLLLCDPDRKRVLRADQALQNAPVWLEKTYQGPRHGQHYQDFVSDIEFEGRELRNQVGPAGWLDLILEGCRLLRKGAWPADLFTALPELVKRMPWLCRFERSERLPASVRPALFNDPSQNQANSFTMLTGSSRGKFGIDQELQLTAPLDAWISEARGSSARVFTGNLRDALEKPHRVAIKLMRMDKVDYSLPLFREEVQILNVMRDVPGITPLLECGFLRLDDDQTLPTEREASVNPALTGTLMRLGPNIGAEFGNQIESRTKEGWTPYLAIEQRDPQENLLALCDASMTGGTYRPLSELLLISIQICEILQEAHLRNIVYRDHKILHYYWIEAMHGVFTIDWNVARLHPEGLPEYEKKMDLVQFGARALHHILTGRTAPGALPLGPTRPDEIEQAAKSYQTQWTYDDQRLPEDLREILERVLAGEYNEAVQLRDDLKHVFLNLPDV